MITPPAGSRIWITAGVTDMHRSFDGLAALVQTRLEADPFSGQIFVFRGRRADRTKLLWWDGDGLRLLCKLLEQGRFIWPKATSGSVSLTAPQSSMLLEGIDWRRPIRTETLYVVFCTYGSVRGEAGNCQPYYLDPTSILNSSWR